MSFAKFKRLIFAIAFVCLMLHENTQAEEVVGEDGFHYEVLPVIDNFCNVIYLKTDNPNGDDLIIRDYDSAYYMGTGEESYASYALCEYLFADVVYEDEDSKRVKGGYIFSRFRGTSDGGELMIYDYSDRKLATVKCPRLIDGTDFIIQNYTKPENAFFTNMDIAQEAADKLSKYPIGLADAESKIRYPLVYASPYAENDLMVNTEIYSKTQKKLFLTYVYPFALDSLSFPYLMESVAKRLNPNCNVEEYSGAHYNITVTLEGESRDYGGAGSRHTDNYFIQDIDKYFIFDGSKEDFVKAATIQNCLDTLWLYDDRAVERTKDDDNFAPYSIFSLEEHSWVRVEGTYIDFEYAYMYKNAYGNTMPADDAWVDGRYVSRWNTWEYGKKFEDQVKANIIVPDMTYISSWGETYNSDVVFRYDEDDDIWKASGCYSKNEDNGILEELILTREEVLAMKPDRNTTVSPQRGFIYDGTKPAGTEFNNYIKWNIANGVLTISGTGDMEDYLNIPAPWYEQKDSINEIVIEEGLNSIGVLAFSGLPNLKRVTIASSIVKIGKSAFENCKKLDSIVIPDSVEIIGAGAFYGCSSLVNVKLSKNITEISSSMFAECSSLKNISLPENVVYISTDAFISCKNLEMVVFGDKLTQIGDQAFEYCEKLKTPKFPNSLVKIGNFAFSECSSIENLVLPENLTKLGWYAFNECTGLKSITFSKKITKLERCVFARCSELTVVELPKQITNIEGSAFSDCVKLKKINIPEGVYKIEGVVQNCPALEMIEIPASVKQIGRFTFYNIYNLTDIYYGGTKEQWDKIFIDGDGNEALYYLLDYGFTTIHYNAKFPKEPVVYENPFEDVLAGKYYTDAVLYLNNRGVMTGHSETVFGVGKKLKREEMVTLLWKNEGKPQMTISGTEFKDMVKNKYYSDAIVWAKNNNIVTGYISGEKAGFFGRGSNITRQDFVKILYGYAKYKGYSVKVASDNTYLEKEDAGEVSKYATEAVNWAYENGLIGNEAPLNPKKEISRQEVAVVIARFLQRFDDIG